MFAFNLFSAYLPGMFVKFQLAKVIYKELFQLCSSHNLHNNFGYTFKLKFFQVYAYFVDLYISIHV